MHDLTIRNGLVVDGTGADARHADVAIDGGAITAVGDDVGAGRQEIDADGAMVAPGWVDVHTHYDGQATWDPEMAPSSWHGATTVVMGNCGVGFAPGPQGQRGLPHRADGGGRGHPRHRAARGHRLAVGVASASTSTRSTRCRAPSTWRPRCPHVALRAYVLGDRAHDEDVTADEYAEMARLTGDALRAGALGFSTSRTILHKSRHGLIPGTHSVPDELLAIGQGDGRRRRRRVPVRQRRPGVLGGGAAVDARAGRARPHGHVLAGPVAPGPRAFVAALDEAAELTAAGAEVFPQVPARPTGMLYGLQTSLHPFIACPSYRPLWNEPLEARVAALRDPELRARLVDEEFRTRDRSAAFLARNWAGIYRLGDPPDYEPRPETSIAAVAEREGRRPEEVAVDWLLEDDGKALLFAPLGSYVDQDHEAIREMISHPASVVGLSDGGAHCGLICDASFPTYLLTHWTRDRERGERLPLEMVVHKQTGATARAYGLHDRGVIAEGKKADVNVVDLDALTLHAPEIVRDLPAGGRRLIQRVDGYRTTIQSGEVTFEDGEPTGARPGTVVRRSA